MRRTPMARRASLLRSVGRRYDRRKVDNPERDTVDLVLVRASSRGFLRCEVCGDPVIGDRGWDWALHHRRGRDGKPDMHSPQNLLVVHGNDNVTACHGRIHRNRAGESRSNGWLISHSAIPMPDPLHVPTLLFGETRWVYLTNDGRYADNGPEVTSART